uniref:Uncharacterized protein n=1 Tax=Lutzomyia longipalpis TaxID=7200 RepID=A0A1B0CKF0_LUTLO
MFLPIPSPLMYLTSCLPFALNSSGIPVSVLCGLMDLSRGEVCMWEEYV